jgi:Ca2+-binding RTX toxin-like protein
MPASRYHFASKNGPFDRIAGYADLHFARAPSELAAGGSLGLSSRLGLEAPAFKLTTAFVQDGIGDIHPHVPSALLVVTPDEAGDGKGLPPGNPVLTVDAAAHTIGTINTIGDQDFYQVTLTAGETYQIGMYGYTGGPGGVPNPDSYVEIYAADGTTLLASGDGGANTPANQANSGFDVLLTFTAETSGTYYINARAFDQNAANGTTGDSVGDYELFVHDATHDPNVYHPYYNDSSPLYAIDWGTRVNKVDQTAANPDGNEGPRPTGNAQGTPTYGSALDMDALLAANGKTAADIAGKNVITIYFAKAGEVVTSLEDPTNPGLPPVAVQTSDVAPFEHNAVMTALHQFELVADVVYLEVQDKSQADFEYASYKGTPGPGISLLGSMEPPDEPNEGLALFNSGDYRWNATDLQQGGFSFVTLIHEIGHGHGLAHPHDNGGHSGVMHGVQPEGAGVADYTTGDYHLNQSVFTMMSYEDGWQDSPYGNAPTTGGYGYLGGLMAFDIAAIQDKYGVNEDTATGDDVYTLKDVNAPGTYYTSIWDAGGTDSIVYGGARDANIDLRPATLKYEWGGGGWVSYAYGIYGGFTIANGVTIENATSGSGNDTLIGNDVANVLDGGAGADTMTGGLGNDTYLVDNLGDRVVEAVGGGYDNVAAQASYILNAGAEVEVLSTRDNNGTAAINLTGNEFGQIVRGNAGNNYLDGGGGGDTLVGGGGDDAIIVNSGDIVVEAVGGGFDNVAAKTSYVLNAGAEVEVLSTTDNAGTAAIALNGNEFGQSLIGNAGNNYLDGGGGADTLIGLGGNDTYIVDADDRVVEAVGGGFDNVAAKTSYVLNAGAEVEVLSTTDNSGTAAIALNGNEFGQSLIGNAGNNYLDGGGGADTLIGLGGNDIFAFTTALGAGNVDRIADFSHGADHIQLAGNAGEPFAALASGTLGAGSFVIGAAALDADDYIIYNSQTGALIYDSDGNGSGAAVQFATLGTGLSLTAADFIVSGPADNAPAISSAATASVAENSPNTTIVYQAQASDADGDRVTWSLSGTDAAALNIDAVTGAVRLNNPADYETKTSYSFSVVASDSAISTSKAVTLTITDVNDTATTPVFSETAAANDSVASSQALDRSTFVVATNADLPDQTLPSATINGSISSNNDIDFYSVTLQAGEVILIDVDHTTNNLDTLVRLYAPDGHQIGFNDDQISADPGSSTPFTDHNTDSFVRFRVATSGTYYFSIESFGDLNNDGDDDGPSVGESSGSYSINVSIGPPATEAQIAREDVDALLSGAQWNHINLTFGFPTAASDYPGNFQEKNTFAPFTSLQQSATTQLLQLVANDTALTFQQLAANPGSADIRYGMSDEPDVAYAYYPTNGGPSSIGSTAWFNKKDFNDPHRGNYSWMGILHETGHALGLKHGHEFPAISADRDSVEYSVMTYRSYPGQDLSGGGGYTNEKYGYPQTPMMYDIAALQKLYGANYGFHANDSVYSWDPTTGEMSINGVGQGAPGEGDTTTSAAAKNRVFMTIWDGGGNDTYDLSNYTTATTIDLRPGEWTTTSVTQLANLGNGHFARGNVANALLYQDNPASLIENAIGGSGSDTLIANQAANHLTGNAGADTFEWMSASDVGTGAAADTIMDFNRGGDRIDLSHLDANPATADHDAFNFLGTGAFTNHAGELRYDVIGGNAHIFADLDGNGVADFEIVVNNVTALTANDFNF